MPWRAPSFASRHPRKLLSYRPEAVALLFSCLALSKIRLLALSAFTCSSVLEERLVFLCCPLKPLQFFFTFEPERAGLGFERRSHGLTTDLLFLHSQSCVFLGLRIGAKAVSAEGTSGNPSPMTTWQFASNVFLFQDLRHLKAIGVTFRDPGIAFHGVSAGHDTAFLNSFERLLYSLLK